MKAKTFDRKFDSGKKIVDQLDLSKARRVGIDACAQLGHQLPVDLDTAVDDHLLGHPPGAVVAQVQTTLKN